MLCQNLFSGKYRRQSACNVKTCFPGKIRKISSLLLEKKQQNQLQGGGGGGGGREGEGRRLPFLFQTFFGILYFGLLKPSQAYMYLE